MCKLKAYDMTLIVILDEHKGQKIEHHIGSDFKLEVTV